MSVPSPSVRTDHRAPLRVGLGELVSAASALMLLICMFALAWFGTDGVPGRVTGAGLLSAEDAWNGLSVLRWLLLLAILVALGSVVLHVTQSAHGTKTDTGLLTLLLAGPTAALLALRVLVDLPAGREVVDQKLGAYLGLVLTVAVALGGWRSLQEEREARRQVAGFTHDHLAPRASAPGGQAGLPAEPVGADPARGEPGAGRDRRGGRRAVQAGPAAQR